MDWFIPFLLRYCMIPGIGFYFFCRCCNTTFKLHWCLIYVTASLLLTFSSLRAPVDFQGCLSVLSGIFLLAFFGIFFMKCSRDISFVGASLAISVTHVIDGITRSVNYLVLSYTKPEHNALLKYIDLTGSFLEVLILILAFFILFQMYWSNIKALHKPAIFLLLIPALFITLVEQVIATAIYGDTIIWDSTVGLAFPQVNNIELLLLQLLALAGLFSSVAAYRKLLTAIESQHKLRLLEQQTHAQAIYVQELQMRHEKTRSFRHDLKNHLTVLGQLLKKEEIEEAFGYLSKLEAVSQSLSLPSQTGNIVADSILESKLSVAQQNRINFQCFLKIPPSSGIKDIDWCILLSNAIDNAIHECCTLPPEKRYIRIWAKPKGNLYLLTFENPCRKGTKIPTDGIGLSNMKAISQNYGGTTEIDITGGIFQLNILLIISEHGKAITHQNY